jgi:hypothetical protein
MSEMRIDNLLNELVPVGPARYGSSLDAILLNDRGLQRSACR